MRIASAYCCAIVTILIATATPLRSPAQVPVVGQRAPDFDLELLSGGRASLAQFRGRPVLLNFWATWCKPCSEELPAIIAAYHAHRDGRLAVLAVNLSDQERLRDVRRFIANVQAPFPILLDERGKVRRRYRLIGVPTTVMIDTAGVVQAIYPGPLTRETLRQGLDRILTTPR